MKLKLRTLYAKPRDPINPVLSSDRAEMSP
jgi:hypothetical protein